MSVIGTSEFEARTLDEIIEANVEKVKSVMERTNLSPSQYLYQIIKIMSLGQYEMEQKMEQILSNVSVVEAAGDSLDRWGVECGILRKGTVRAIGELEITRTADDTLLSPGETFSTNNGIQFETTEHVSFSTVIACTRGSDQTDAIPSPISALESIDWINTARDQSGTPYTTPTDYSYAGDVITWVAGHGPAENATYYVGTSGSMTVTASIQAVAGGTSGNVPIGSITINQSSVSCTVTNPDETSYGLDGEGDQDYRLRLLDARRRNFTLGKVKDLLAEIDGVRSVKVVQDTGVDQASVGETGGDPDWETYHLSGGAISTIYNDEAIIQTFFPSTETMSIRAVTVTGQRVGVPPSLNLKLAYWTEGQEYTGSETSLAGGYFRSDDVDPDSPTTWQDLQIPLRYGGLDYSRTYALIFTQSGCDNENYWNLMSHGSGYGSNWRKQLSFHSGTTQEISGEDLIFKTHYGGPSFTVTIATETSASWGDVLLEASSLVDDEELGGYTPVCIQANIHQASEVYINVEATIYVDDAYSFATISANVETEIQNYVNNIDAGTNVVYSKIMYCIMKEPGVLKCTNLKIKRNNGSWITATDQSDILIGDDEVAVLDTGAYGPGTIFTEG